MGKASPRPAAHTQFCLLFCERLRSLARNNFQSIINRPLGATNLYNSEFLLESHWSGQSRDLPIISFWGILKLLISQRKRYNSFADFHNFVFQHYLHDSLSWFAGILNFLWRHWSHMTWCSTVGISHPFLASYIDSNAWHITGRGPEGTRTSFLPCGEMRDR